MQTPKSTAHTGKESTIHILNDGLNESKTELQATDPSKDLSEQHYDYIHHFKYQENLATSPQLPIKVGQSATSVRLYG